MFLAWDSMDSGLCFLCVKVWIQVSVFVYESMDSGLCFLRRKVWILVDVSSLGKYGFWSVFFACESVDSGLCFLRGIV